MIIPNPLKEIRTQEEADRFLGRRFHPEAMIFERRGQAGRLCNITGFENRRSAGTPWSVRRVNGRRLVAQAQNQKESWYVIPLAAFDNPLARLKEPEDIMGSVGEWGGLKVHYWELAFRFTKSSRIMTLDRTYHSLKLAVLDEDLQIFDYAQAKHPYKKGYIYPFEHPFRPTTEGHAAQLGRIFLGG